MPSLDVPAGRFAHWALPLDFPQDCVQLTAGSRLGVYDVLGSLGAGGMGEVYRATDTQLGRQVALKVLPESVAADAQRLARFDREARTLATLNHPNIAQIYGIADGIADGAHTRALVMELVEGATLADRIAEGPIPLDESLAIARQIADALEAAHDQGIIHRDLKPANIKVRPDGKVKVLDFGLAKAIEGAGEAGRAGTAGGSASMSPTITTPAMTQAGMILGTAAYMSPEQARGRPLDRRTDIWAFGCVLFEMLTGKRAFPGDDITDTLAAIVRGEPEWRALPADVPGRVHKAMQLCLQKDQSRRIRDIGDVRLTLDGAFDHAAATAATATAAPPRMQALTWMVLAALVVALVVAGIGWTRRPASAPPTVARFALPITPGDTMPDLERPLLGFALSPDERTMVYTAYRKEVRQLFRRQIGELVPIPIAGTETGTQPFFSPDGKWVGYFNEKHLSVEKVEIAGGVPVTITAVTNNPAFAAWLSDGTIVYGMRGQPLTKVSDNGGPTSILVPTERGEFELRSPSAVPGRRAIVFSDVPANLIQAFDLDTGKRTKLIPGTDPHVTNDGELVFIRDGTLWAAPFDSKALAVTGDAKLVLSDPTAGAAILQSAIGANGTLIYASGRLTTADQQPYTVSWVDQHGQVQPLSLPPRGYDFPRLSPDGARLAIAIRTERDKGPTEHDLWVFDLRTGAGLRLTHAGDNRLPLWTADGQRILFSSTDDAPPPAGSTGVWWGNLYQVRADGSHERERVTKTPENQALTGISSDGREMFYTRVVTSSEWHVMRVSVDKPNEATPITSGKFSHGSGEVSPDGHLISYRSNESGKFEIYVQPYPSLDGKIAVSVGGGLEPIWSADSKTLFYRAGDKVMAVEITEKPQLRGSTPRELFAGAYIPGTAATGREYHVAPDRRFVMMKLQAVASNQPADQPFIAVLNWFQELHTRLGK